MSPDCCWKVGKYKLPGSNQIMAEFIQSGGPGILTPKYSTLNKQERIAIAVEEICYF
jgi:hypothetical protein